MLRSLEYNPDLIPVLPMKGECAKYTLPEDYDSPVFCVRLKGHDGYHSTPVEFAGRIWAYRF